MSEPRTRDTKWAVAAAVGLGFAFVYWIRTALLPFVLAAGLAYVVNPLMLWLIQRCRWPRWLATIVIFAAYLCLFGGGVYWVETVLLPQALALGKEAPDLLQQLFQELAKTKYGHAWLGNVNIAALTSSITDTLIHWVGGPGQVLATAFEMVMGLFLTLVLLFYFLLSGPRIMGGLFSLVPPSLRPRVQVLGLQISPMLASYIRGLLVIVLYATGLTWVGVGLLLRLPHAALLSLTTGLLELVPVIGPIISATLLAVVAISKGSIWLALGFAAFALVLRLSIDQVVGPIVLGKAVTLHPVAIIFAFLVGGMLYGIIGVLLAVPVAASIKIVLETYYRDAAQPQPPPPA